MKNNDIVYINLDSITPADYNPRFLNDNAREMLVESLSKLGVVKPIIVNGDNNVILAGHQRTSVMKSIGIKECPAFIVHNVNKQDEVRFNQFHNRCEYEYSEDSLKIKIKSKLKLGWNKVKCSDIDVKNKGNKSYENKVLCMLIAKYGSFGSSICNENGDVIISAGYALCSKVTRVELDIYCVNREQEELCKYYFSKNYGVFSYDNINRNTYVQGLAQMIRLPKTGKAKHSTLYETHIIPNLEGIYKNCSFLDFGAGRYEYAEMLKKHGVDIDFVDPYHMKTIGVIDEKNNRSRLKYICERIRDKGLYDVVICDSVLNSVDSEEARKSVILTCYGLCKENGNIIISGRTAPISSSSISTTKKNTGYFLDDNGYSATMRNNNWFFQKFDTRKQIDEIATLIGKSKIFIKGEVWQIVAKKEWKEELKEDVLKALEFEWNLPIPSGLYELGDEIKNHIYMQYPIITEFSTNDHFGYLWLKYVNGYDLSVHCAKSLIGNYSNKIDATIKSAVDISLDEHDCRYYYLCGVTRPYIYRNNLHLCFKYKQGSEVYYNDGKTSIRIKDAERIDILNLGNYSNEPNGSNAGFYTCRNWRFAYQMKYGIGI